MTATEIVIIGLGCAGVIAGVSGAWVAASMDKKVRSAPTLSFLVSLGRVVFAGGVALFLGSFAAVLHEPLGREGDLMFALTGKVLGLATALLGGYMEEHAKHSLLHRLDAPRRTTPDRSVKEPVAGV